MLVEIYKDGKQYRVTDSLRFAQLESQELARKGHSIRCWLLYPSGKREDITDTLLGVRP